MNMMALWCCAELPHGTCMLLDLCLWHKALVGSNWCLFIRQQNPTVKKERFLPFRMRMHETGNASLFEFYSVCDTTEDWLITVWPISWIKRMHILNLHACSIAASGVNCIFLHFEWIYMLNYVYTECGILWYDKLKSTVTVAF